MRRVWGVRRRGRRSARRFARPHARAPRSLFILSHRDGVEVPVKLGHDHPLGVRLEAIDSDLLDVHGGVCDERRVWRGREEKCARCVGLSPFLVVRRSPPRSSGVVLTQEERISRKGEPTLTLTCVFVCECVCVRCRTAYE